MRRLGWEIVPGRKVLDAGCGPAGVFISLYEQEKVTAIDPLLEQYEQDLAIFARQDYPQVQFRVGTLEALTKDLGQFSAIYCFNAISHVADWGLCLDNLTALATPGTRLLLTSDVHLSIPKGLCVQSVEYG